MRSRVLWVEGCRVLLLEYTEQPLQSSSARPSRRLVVSAFASTLKLSHTGAEGGGRLLGQQRCVTSQSPGMPASHGCLAQHSHSQPAEGGTAHLIDPYGGGGGSGGESGGDGGDGGTEGGGREGDDIVYGSVR